jgi:hypothetical protein
MDPKVTRDSIHAEEDRLKKGVFMALWILLPCVAGAQTVRVDKLVVRNSGIYTADTLKVSRNPDSVTGTLRTATNVRFTSKSHNVPLKLGTRFGFQGLLPGSPKGTTVALKTVHIFPAKGLRNPKTKDVTYREEYEVNKTIGDILMSGYILSNKWELVPGKWTLQLWYGDEKIAEEIFTLADPAAP